MIKRVLGLLLAVCVTAGMAGCASLSTVTKQSRTYLDAFDTVTEISAYGIGEEAFAADVEELHDLMLDYHRLYDIYNAYPELTNLHAVNAAAGGEPVAVDSRILDLLDYGLDAYKKTGGQVNILYGAVLSLWHDRRAAALDKPEDAALPNAAALTAAAKHCDPATLKIDRVRGTVCITDPQARLDVGAIAKGYVTEQIALYAAETLGWTSALISVGGNIRAIGGKGAETFAIGIQNPDTAAAQPYIATVRVKDTAVVTSGDYQRYYTVDGTRYAHIIDPAINYPPTYVRAVSVICADAAMADVLSTALFTLPVERGLALLSQTEGAEALWVLPDGGLRYSDGFKEYVT